MWKDIGPKIMDSNTDGKGPGRGKGILHIEDMSIIVARR